MRKPPIQGAFLWTFRSMLLFSACRFLEQNKDTFAHLLCDPPVPDSERDRNSFLYKGMPEQVRHGLLIFSFLDHFFSNGYLTNRGMVFY
jgi:hypothetical protein